MPDLPLHFSAEKSNLYIAGVENNSAFLESRRHEGYQSAPVKDSESGGADVGWGSTRSKSEDLHLDHGADRP